MESEEILLVAAVFHNPLCPHDNSHAFSQSNLILMAILYPSPPERAAAELLTEQQEIAASD